MLPVLLLYPIWLAVSLGWPVLQSLHALHLKDDAGVRLWLFYWVLYAMVSGVCTIPFVATVLTLPLTIVGAVFLDVYYETLIAGSFLLVSPKHNYLERLLCIAESNYEPACKVCSAYVEKVRPHFAEVEKKVKEMLAPKA
ncbi:unnamed protein product [Amoebophrya sp. A25]|nr:unnamed protein product [Amoebophrya sp. A25]|eukprot:GSA25T00015729001.1